MFPFQVFRELQPTLAGGFKNLGQVIRSLFANGEQGVWYDPSDFSTMFQDSAGTTPVTAVEQPVGLMLDKSKGLLLGPELISNPVNGSVSGLWQISAGTVTRNGATTGQATVTANSNQSLPTASRYEVTFVISNFSGDSIGFRVGGGTAYGPISANGSYRYVVPGGGSTALVVVPWTGTSGQVTVSNISVRELPGNHASQPTATSRPVLSARVNQYLATETLATQDVTTLAAQYRLSFEGAGTITLSGAATGVYSAGSHLITCTAGTLTSTVSGSVTKADLRVANTGAGLPAYQRVNTATDYDTVGFPHYLRFDGVDDWLVTPTITPGVDKAQVFAGVRKFSQSARGSICEISNTTTNGIGISENGLVGDSYRSYSGGSQLSAIEPTGFVSPITNILTGLSDISGDRATLRVNGVQAAQSTADQGTGNYLAYPLYIGRRGGTTLPFNGHLYGLIIRFGANLPTATIEKTEKYINQKTRAY